HAPAKAGAYIFFLWSSELQTQHALNHARAASHNSAGCANRRRCGAAESRRDFSEVRTALIVLRICEIRVVEQIEELGAELQADRLRELESLRGREVVVLQTRPVELIAAGGPNASGGRSFGEVVLIECGINVPVVLVKFPGPDNVRPVVELVKPA